MLRRLNAILIDLDNTLYPPECGLLAAGDERITAFLQKRLGLPRKEADAERQRLWRSYGTTARGLAVEYGIPEEEMCREALETMDPTKLLRPDPELPKALEALGVPVYLFTNATRVYAERVLGALGVAEAFAGIFDIAFLGWEGKPKPQAFRRVLETIGYEAETLALADDHPPNLQVARELGMVTVAVGVDCPANYRIAGIKDLPIVLHAAGLL